MSRRKLRSLPRRVMPSNRGTRSRAEAAIELVRLEYERERLSNGIEAARMTLEGMQEGLARVEGRIDQVSLFLTPAPRVTRRSIEPRGSLSC